MQAACPHAAYLNCSSAHEQRRGGLVKRIAYVLGEFPSISETFILREIRAMRDLGYDIVLFSLRRPAAQPVHRSALLMAAGVHYAGDEALSRAARAGDGPAGRLRGSVAGAFASLVHRHRRRPRAWLAAVRQFPAAVAFAREAQRLDIQHVHAHFAFVTADVAAVMAELMGVGFSVSAHAWDIYFTSGNEIRARLLNAEFVAACTRRNRDCLLGALGSPWESRVHLVYHGVDPTEFRRREAGGDVVLAVGRLIEKKGFRDLIDACRVLKDRGVNFRCELVGDGPLRRDLETQIQALGLGDAVALRGMLSEEDLIPVYAQAGIVVVPSVLAAGGDRDGLPNVILEAMALQVPVVSTSVSGIPEAVENGGTGFLVEPGRPDALADGIERLLKDPGLRNRMGAKARARLEAEFDIRKNVRPLAELFDACIRRARPEEDRYIP